MKEGTHLDKYTDKKIIQLLVADDDRDDCFLIEKACRKSKHNFQLTFVEDGEDLVDYLMHKGKYQDQTEVPPPDLLLLDLNMPKMNGMEALKVLKSESAIKGLPIAILTTSDSDTDMYTSFGMGVNSFITKPDDFQELIKAMDELGEIVTSNN